jgi:hypothetical protein
MWQRFLLLIALILCGQSAQASLECRNWVLALDQAILDAGVNDAASTRISGFPYLRANRWLAYLQTATITDAQQEQWLRLAANEAITVLTLELKQLDPIHPLLTVTKDWRQRLQHCVDTLVALSGFPGVPIIDVADNYSTRNRLFGLYKITQLLARPSMNNYRDDMTQRFKRPFRLPIRHYQPEPFSGTPPPPELLSRNPLEVPLPADGARQALLSHYAPVLSVANTLAYNQPGAVHRDAENIHIDYSQPTAYSWLSWTHFRGHNLLQLNYQFWFSERPKKGSMDLYGGKLDSIIWRVTLKPDGQVLMYDSIHGCGCYHKIYRVANGLMPASDGPAAPVLYPAPVPNARSTRVSLVVEPDTHYIVRVEEFSPGQQMERYRLSDANDLRALPVGDGFKSLYRNDGLIPQSVRGERMTLWPLGVPSAGAMRQPGTHAIAFIGRQHFDNPKLLDSLFKQ